MSNTKYCWICYEKLLSYEKMREEEEEGRRLAKGELIDGRQERRWQRAMTIRLLWLVGCVTMIINLVVTIGERLERVRAATNERIDAGCDIYKCVETVSG
jgi:hypothetical protein